MKLLCLDFDGVICDSAGETGATGWRAAHQLWPGEFTTDPPANYLADFRRLRPYLETGYESILMARLWQAGVRQAGTAASYHELVRQEAEKSGQTRAALVAAFGGVRDQWLSERFGDWLALHTFYPGTLAALARWRAAGVSCQILTTKEQRFALALLRHGGLDWPPDQLFGLEDGPKPPRLQRLLAAYPAANAHFVEDRLATLQAVAARPDLSPYHLHLADWGYLTPADLTAVTGEPRIQRLSLAAFVGWETKPVGDDKQKK